MFEEVIDINKLPKLDLHGEYSETSRMYINDFVNENIKLKNKYIAIIHGKGKGILKKVTLDTLKTNKNVVEYKICLFNDGMTLVKLNLK